jgi:hypothetical protein
LGVHCETSGFINGGELFDLRFTGEMGLSSFSISARLGMMILRAVEGWPSSEELSSSKKSVLQWAKSI